MTRGRLSCPGHSTDDEALRCLRYMNKPSGMADGIDGKSEPKEWKVTSKIEDETAQDAGVSAKKAAVTEDMKED